MTGKTRVWPVKSTIRPDIVRWPAVILSPVTHSHKDDILNDMVPAREIAASTRM